ncbi:GNAT family N-acetyltransferase [Listeria sp. FSL L7-1435]|uniref:GNAT family N-acetyltransferase n=1 Tax=Listeria cossartiae TaxID=2838249 RepID=UPI0016260B21|nr:GNAT family N-acetyltransferase [Listeria cossartiae]MBC1548210.1 GNAT family N-acetyltransferase [Listeria cossartiae subsp. cossartiae]MBC1548955.1 GNAT family N-acetyltransferase [Listeria cossartiae subsp. cossartiae]MBC1567416.1 GNAT family N-acetyltransferase [Listeria cossartiae subsp. cossartiae]MBC1570572.1 GNAT family N-acetyltransferase [Listeria cossartiae subsp. cossartiae]
MDKEIIHAKKVDTKYFPLILTSLLSSATFHPLKALELYNNNKNCTLYTTPENNGLIGVRMSRNYCEILHIAVSPSFQEKGIASLMIQQIINLNSSIEIIILETDSEAVIFYEKSGFHPIKLPSKYPNVTRFFCVYNSKNT